MAGTFYNTTDLGLGPITTDPPQTVNNSDIFVAEIDPNTEKAVWMQAFPGVPVSVSRQGVRAFAANSSGQLALVGPFVGQLTVAGSELDALYDGDQYVLGTSTTNGTGLWVRRLNLQGSLSRPVANGLRGIAGDPQSGAFVVCGTATKDASDLSSSLKGAWHGGQDIVLAAIDGSPSGAGSTTWASQVGGKNDEGCDGVAMDAQSNIYAMGTYRFDSEVIFGTLALPVVNDTTSVRMFLVKLDSKGQGIWQAILGSGNQTITPSAILALGSDVVVAGTVVSGDLSLNGVDLGGSANWELFPCNQFWHDPDARAQYPGRTLCGAAQR